MNKQIILEKYIKVAVKKALKEQEEQQKRAEKALYLVYRFPGLKKLMEDLMSPVFGRFMSHIEIVAPKPTTFNVKLINNQEFGIIYVGKGNFMVKIAGKKYNPLNLGELERASNAIADLLQLNYAPEEGKEQQPSSEESIKSDLETAEKPAETTPTEEETPPPVAEGIRKKVKTLNEIFMTTEIRQYLNEAKVASIKVGQTFTLSSDIGKFKKGENITVKEKTPYGNDIRLVLVNDNDITDDFYLDRNDDFEALD